jgi:hypothetical protein
MFLYRFYGSIVVGVVLVGLAVLLRGSVPVSRVAGTASSTGGDLGDGGRDRASDDESYITLQVPLFAFSVQLPWRFKRSSVVRSALLLGALFLFWQAASVDFASIFPSRMGVEVFYDVDGIRKTLKEFTPDELRDVNVPRDWEARLPGYDQVIRRHLATAWHDTDPKAASDTGFIHRENLHARGETTFLLERLGFLDYHVRESEGVLDQMVDAPGATFPSFRTSFSLRNTPDDFIHATIPEVLSRGSIILKPRFKEAIATDARGASVQIDHVIVAMTKVHLWYYPRLGRTLYLWVAPDGKLVPVGYGVYTKF